MFYAFKIGIREKIELLSFEAKTKEELLEKIKEEDSVLYEKVVQNEDALIEADNVTDAKELYIGLFTAGRIR